MNADRDNDTDVDYEEGSFLDRIKESPRTVSALIIILIVAAAIYAFSGGEQNQEGVTTDQAAVTSPEVGSTTTPAGSPLATAPDETTAAPVVSRAPVTQEELQQQAQTLPEPRKTDEGYVEVTQAGEGITHLSRRATTRWLSENQAGYTVTNEHRIFIEDYIQNRLGTEGLRLGEERTVSFSLVQEAVNAAKELNDSQLQNLGQYTYVLT